MIPRYFFTSLLFSLLVSTSFAQTAVVKGTVKTSDGQPAELVNVGLKGTNKAAIADKNGNYKIENVEAGSYSLIASYVGLESKEETIIVKAGETITIDFVLKESAKQLQEVVIEGGRNKYISTETDYVAKLPLKNMENPQVYSTVTKDLIQDQVVTDLNGALKNVPGVTLLLQDDNSGGDFASRGFVTDAYLRNGMADYIASAVDPANIERIEAIKGPSATLFGSSLTSYGGLFNRITKKPFDAFKGEVSYTAGSYGLNRITADINTPLNADKTALFRLNIAGQHEGSFMDAGFSNRLFIAPSLFLQVNSRLSILMDAEIYQQQNTMAFRFFPEPSFTLITPQQLHFDYTRSFTSNDVTANAPSNNIYTQINYKLSDKWRSQTNFSYTSTSYKGMFAWNSVLPGDTTVGRNMDDENDINNTFEVQQNFIGDFKTGPIRHRLVAGIDLFGYEDNGSYGYRTFDTVHISGPDPEYSNLNSRTINEAFVNTYHSHDINKQYDYSAYASDVINITGNLIAMLSLRVDYFDNRGDQDIVADTITGKYNQTALSPKFGLVYQIIKNRIALFGNYMNGFQNQNGEDHNHNPFKPQQANQMEGGLKFNLFGSKLTSTLSYYDIKVNDILRTDPDFPDFSVQNGKQYSKGFEAEVIANPFTGFNIIVGYAHNDSKYEEVDPTLDGHRPSSAGPADVANLWLSYRIAKGVVKGLGFGFGGNYAGKNNILDESDGIFTLPSYTVLNASLSYEQPKYRLSLKMDNLANKQYWVGWYTIIPQMPRHFSASLAVKF